MDKAVNKLGIYRPDRSTDYIVTALPSVAITQKRLPYTDWHVVKQPGVARANIAPTERNSEGTDHQYNTEHSRQSVLQQHIAFFDLNDDGVITPYETYIGFRLIGWNIFLSIIAMFIIHLGFSYVSLPSDQWIPDPFFRIYTANAHGMKHGSDTGTYDTEGRFRPQQFADFFSKYGKKLDDGDWGMTYKEALMGIKGQRAVADFFGWFAELCEWSATFFTIWPADGVMRMEDVRAVYDGSYFYKIGGQRREKYIMQHIRK